MNREGIGDDFGEGEAAETKESESKEPLDKIADALESVGKDILKIEQSFSADKMEEITKVPFFEAIETLEKIDFPGICKSIDFLNQKMDMAVILFVAISSEACDDETAAKHQKISEMINNLRDRLKVMAEAKNKLLAALGKISGMSDKQSGKE